VKHSFVERDNALLSSLQEVFSAASRLTVGFLRSTVGAAHAAVQRYLLQNNSKKKQCEQT